MVVSHGQLGFLCHRAQLWVLLTNAVGETAAEWGWRGGGGEVHPCPSWTEEVGSRSEGLLVAGAASVPRMVPAHF